jgi:hypothetical protein
MSHRRIRGKILYVGDKSGERGREWFTITVEADGCRTVRAMCEMDDSGILRDVTYVMDADFRPRHAYNRVSIKGVEQGSAWFHFDDHGGTCEGQSRTVGRFTQRINTAGPVESLVTHPIVCDGLQCAGVDTSRPGARRVVRNSGSSSLRADGGEAPGLTMHDRTLEFVGFEKVTVPAGAFDTIHFRVLPTRAEVQGNPPLEVWSTPGDFVFVKMRWDLLNCSYHLVEIEGLSA